MFHFQCPCGANLVFPLQMGRSHEILCPRCFESFFIIIDREPIHEGVDDRAL